MKNYLLLICCALFVQITSATTFNQLCTVNKYWQTQADAAIINELNNTTTHLIGKSVLLYYLIRVAVSLVDMNLLFAAKIPAMGW